MNRQQIYSEQKAPSSVTLTLTHTEQQLNSTRGEGFNCTSGMHDWIGLCSVLRPLQHSIGYTGDSFYRSKDPTNSIKVLKEATKENKNNTITA